MTEKRPADPSLSRRGRLPAPPGADPLPAWVRRAVGLIDGVSEWSGRFTAWLIIPLIGIITWEIVARYVFNAPTIWAFELQFMLYASMFMLAAPYTLLYGEHIRTDILYNRFSIRWQGLIDAALYLLFYFPGIAFFLWAGWDFAARSWALGERSEFSPWRPPIYPLKTVIPLTAALLLLQGLSEFAKSLYAATTGRRYGPGPGGGQGEPL